MKILFLFISFSLLSGSFCYSQNLVGVKGGPSFSTVNFDRVDPTSYTGRLGYQVGFFAEFHPAGDLFLRPELLYALKGGTFVDNSTGNKGRLNFNYINVPILVGYAPVHNLSLLFGPEIGYLLAASSRLDQQKIDMKGPFSVYRNLDLGLALGVVYAISPKLMVDARFVQGFRMLTKSTFTGANGNPTETVRDGRNSTFQFGLGYVLREE